MKRLVTSLCFVMLLVSGCQTTSSSSINKGVDAFEMGDYATALSKWKPLAEQGDKIAQYNMGLLYDIGNGVPRDFGTAVKWYMLVARQGFIKVQNNLGKAYYVGRGVAKNYMIALKWLTLAAKQGDKTAQYNLGWLHGLGRGVPKSSKTAVKWWRLAAKQGHPKAKKFLKDPELRPFVKELEEEERLTAAEEEKARVDAKKAKTQNMVAPYKSRCSAFGFKDGSKEMSKCIFDLYKLDKAKSQSRTVIQNNSGDSSAVRALLEEQKKQRQLEGSLELMKRGFEMMKPPRRNSSNGLRIGPKGGVWNCWNGICAK